MSRAEVDHGRGNQGFEGGERGVGLGARGWERQQAGVLQDDILESCPALHMALDDRAAATPREEEKGRQREALYRFLAATIKGDNRADEEESDGEGEKSQKGEKPTEASSKSPLTFAGLLHLPGRFPRQTKPRSHRHLQPGSRPRVCSWPLRAWSAVPLLKKGRGRRKKQRQCLGR